MRKSVSFLNKRSLIQISAGVWIKKLALWREIGITKSPCEQDGGIAHKNVGKIPIGRIQSSDFGWSKKDALLSPGWDNVQWNNSKYFHYGKKYLWNLGQIIRR